MSEHRGPWSDNEGPPLEARYTVSGSSVPGQPFPQVYASLTSYGLTKKSLTPCVSASYKLQSHLPGNGGSKTHHTWALGTDR